MRRINKMSKVNSANRKEVLCDGNDLSEVRVDSDREPKIDSVDKSNKGSVCENIGDVRIEKKRLNMLDQRCEEKETDKRVNNGEICGDTKNESQ
ncbi:hypothetical protein HanXRQr2_Chr13g0571261 [Helianthus annuus]|uniref:Uncharacterized protein n=1 Tax=Helianthus annuus TaxID=4232 RepID=A0A9K3HAA8_HELAN|nr:hypothetical protein HanXRQr2_Chr13g0571261 [Helianthus annuus]KAJ0475674.1 hypothetical protein HanHA300_Chr13g0468261 [Helianthus annuus]KAJ0496457.1 hypothetical protein HanHA89_Chr13g0500001 [Helianthus annuus]KAJ0662514.1 hypothetical protein HanLR1_Chr13g0470411 [Helianthus annuus]KAJ0670039.1 hypothetical protein HanOQP8_Chr13g0469501 [Helianthus annuus]